MPDGGWNDALESLIRDEDARSWLVARGLRWAAGESILEHVEEWEAAMEHAAGLAAAARA